MDPSPSDPHVVGAGAPSGPPARSRRVALVLAAAGLVAAAAGALLPWFTSGSDVFGDEALAPRLVAVAVAGVAVAGVVARTRLAAVPALIALAVAVVVALGESPGQMCWDGADAQGNPVGGCDQQEWTAGPVPFLVGCWLVAAAGVVTAAGARRPAAVR